MSRTLAELVRDSGPPELAAYVEAAEKLRVFVRWEDPCDDSILEYDAAAMALFQSLACNP